ncbi:MAG: endosialidase [Anaerotignum sp.]
MAVIEEIIRQEKDGTLSFGNYLANEKKKVLDFEANGDLYNVKTYNEITKLEKNGKLLMEVVPGATIHKFSLTESGTNFMVEGPEDVQLTLEIEPQTEYKILIDDVNVGKVKTNMAGKVTVGVELQNNMPYVKVVKVG